MAISESVIQRRWDRVRVFTEPEAAWLAAAIDAEAHISYRQRYIGSNGDPVKSARIKLNMTNREFVERFNEIIGGVSKIRETEPAKSHWKKQYVVEINGWYAVAVLDQLLNYLIIKREDAINIICDMEETRSWH